MPFFLGLIGGHVAFLVSWAVLGDDRLHTRLPAAILLAVLVWYAVLALHAIAAPSSVALSDSSSTSDLLMLGVFDMIVIYLGPDMAVGFLIMQIPLYVARLAFGWRLEVTRSADRSGAQFTIRYLLFWTAAVALVLGLGRLVMSGRIFLAYTIGMTFELVAISTLTGTFLLMAALPWVWVVFLKRRLPLWIVAAAALSGGVTIAEKLLLTRIEPWFNLLRFILSDADSARTTEFLLDLLLMHTSAILALTLSLLVMRAAGYRLVQNGTSRID